MKNFKEVTHEELTKFLDNFSNLYVESFGRSRTQFEYHDHSEGKVWPESVVAVSYEDSLDSSKSKYYVKEEI